jgi:hypothetical protein
MGVRSPQPDEVRQGVLDPLRIDNPQFHAGSIPSLLEGVE